VPGAGPHQERHPPRIDSYGLPKFHCIGVQLRYSALQRSDPSLAVRELSSEWARPAVLVQLGQEKPKLRQRDSEAQVRNPAWGSFFCGKPTAWGRPARPRSLEPVKDVIRRTCALGRRTGQLHGNLNSYHAEQQDSSQA
jgi:hypothetical protein